MPDFGDAGRIEFGPAAGGTLVGAKGFTPGDVKLLQEAHQRGLANGGWGRGQFAANEFSQYLAIWDNAAADLGPPTLVIARFAKTGTYALLVQGKIVASGGTLDIILPALAAVNSRSSDV